MTENVKADSLIEPLIKRAEYQPEQPVLVFVKEDGAEHSLNAAQFQQDILRFSRSLGAIGIQEYDLVILVLRHSEELISAFWGAIYIGAIPSIFPFLTEKLDPVLYMQKVRLLVDHSGARAVITFPEFKGEISTLLSGVDCQVLSTDDVLYEEVNIVNPPGWQFCSGEKIAFLQHSSGTTGLQKGVALSHRAVLNQLEAYSRAIALNSDDVIVSWLPLYHDMGLIAGFVMPIVLGVPLVLISPFHWVRDPKILLWAIHRHKGTLSWLPNFAYNHCARNIRTRDLQGLDLSTWRAAINCSEPVRYDSHQLFLERFGPYGFHSSSLATCYAMAENTFAVTQSPPDRPPHIDWVHLKILHEERQAISLRPNDPGAIPLVSCGIPIQGTKVAVGDESGQQLPERHVAEIIIRGNSMLREYHRRPDLTAQAIHHGWYFTGDMGYLADGHLYVTGRKKDLIIVGGKNIYPQDLEAIANQVPGIYPGRAVAFGLFDERLGSEGIVMICELNGSVRDDSVQIERELRQQIVWQMDVALADLCLVERHWLIKTSSGKIARSENRDKYLRDFRPLDVKNS